MAKYWVRREYRFIDALKTEDEEIRRGFMEDAPTLGKIQTGGKTASAHVLFTKPLMIGAALSSLASQQNTVFHPLSPGIQTDYTTCTLVGSDSQVDYAILKCEELEGSGMRLKSAFPKLSALPDVHFLSFNTLHQEKVVGTGPPTASDAGGFLTDQVGSNHLTAVVTAAGVVPVSDSRLHDLYDQHIWRLCRLYSREMQQHYFTYFRQYEEDKGLEPVGSANKVNFWRYQNAKEWKVRTAIRNAYLSVRSFFIESREPSI